MSLLAALAPMLWRTSQSNAYQADGTNSDGHTPSGGARTPLCLSLKVTTIPSSTFAGLQITQRETVFQWLPHTCHYSTKEQSMCFMWELLTCFSQENLCSSESQILRKTNCENRKPRIMMIIIFLQETEWTGKMLSVQWKSSMQVESKSRKCPMWSPRLRGKVSRSWDRSKGHECHHLITI